MLPLALPLPNTRPQRNACGFPAPDVCFPQTMMTLLRSLLGAVRSFLRTQRDLALENQALCHQIGVLERTGSLASSRSAPSRRARVGGTPKNCRASRRPPPLALHSAGPPSGLEAGAPANRCGKTTLRAKNV